ncbi:DUF4349 domain-containing protein [Flavobacterium sp. 3HN19-14]|uniref:DUF4349 domain-containing protein n=1 Tax=Flavobacterium sp. 3HN19-14 TaxID=3448133 RepID=UPI003EE00A31
MKKIALCFFALLLIVGCKEAAAETETTTETTENFAYEKISPNAAPAEVAAYENTEADTTAAAAEGSVESPSDENFEPKIIKNASLRFETSDLAETYAQIQTAVKKHKGIVQMDAEGTDYSSMYKNLTLRIPSADFDGFIADVSKGVKYFERKEIASEDVSEEFVDVASRIKTKKALESRYLELLKKAGKVSEMLEVEKKLFEIREEIEAKEGRLKFLQNRVSMSTISIEFFKRTAVQNGATVSYGTKIGNALKSGFNGISNFFLWLIEVWPFILILVALIYLIRKRLRKKNK